MSVANTSMKFPPSSRVTEAEKIPRLLMSTGSPFTPTMASGLVPPKTGISGSDRGASDDCSGANNGAYNRPHLAPYLGADVP